MNVLNRSQIQTAGRLHENDERRMLLDLPTDNRFLLITAGHGPEGSETALTAANVILIDQPYRISLKLVEFENALLCERHLEILAETKIVAKVEVKKDTILLTVFRNIGNAVLRPLADLIACDVLAVQNDLALAGLYKTRDRVGKLDLTVSGNAGDGKYLTLTNLE